MSRLALFLLGPPKIERDGQPVKLSRRKAIALLAYLAVTAGSHPRDSLVNLLWPELDGARGRAALRRTLYTLNKALGSDWLEVDREEIGLQPDAGLWVDVLQFLRHLAECENHEHPAARVCPACLPSLTEAVALVRADFLSGFSLKDSVNFDDWQLFQAEVLRRRLGHALERLVDWHTGQREFELAARHARRKLALDPMDEEAHRQLMRLYTWSGRRTAALRQYEECVVLLEEHLGVPPQEATTDLYRAIQAGQAPPPPEKGWEGEVLEHRAEAPAFLEGEVQVERLVFVAREQELAQLEGHLEAALAGRGKVVFVTGEAGSGKTALVQEFTRRAQKTHGDLVVASGNCNAYTGIGDPYLPFREILELLTGDVRAKWAAGTLTREHACRLWHTLPHTAQALVEAGPALIDTFIPRATLLERARTYAPREADWLARLDEPWERAATGPGVPGLQQVAVFEHYAKVLQALALQVPLVLVVDDLQWADAGSINLLFHLGRQLAGYRILVVGAYRPEEVDVGRGDGRHPLEPVVNEFQRVFGDIVVDVDRAERREFVETFLDSEPNRLERQFREMFYQQTRGHPLFATELLRGLQERKDIVRDSEGRWIEGPTLDWETLPARVEAVIAERIGRLLEPLRTALNVACVEGEGFTAEVVARVLETDERTMVHRLSNELDKRHRLVRAEALGLLQSRRVSRYRFRHHLFQKYLYENLDAAERAYLHEDVGNVLEELYGDQASEVAVELARHFQEARSTHKAIHYLHQAGERAVQQSAYQEGITHLSRAMALLMALPDSAERAQQELALQLSLGVAWMWDVRDPEYRNTYLRARELCRQTGETAQLWRILTGLVIFHFGRAEHHKARELAEEALSLAQQADDPLVVAVSHWCLGFIFFTVGEYAPARLQLGRVIAFYNPEQHHRSIVFLRGADAGVSALAYDACCLWCLGYPEQALQRSQQALDMARELDHAFSLADVLCYGGCMLHEMRRDAPALRDHAEELTRLLDDTRLATWFGTGASYLGEALAMLGEVEAGIALMQEGMTARTSAGAWCNLSGTLGALAEAQAKAGQPAEGLATLAQALAQVELSDERYWEAELHRLRAEILLTQGDETEAEASLHRAIQVAQCQGAKSWELRATIGLSRLWQKQDRLDEALSILTEIYDWFTEGFDTRDLQEAKALLEELT